MLSSESHHFKISYELGEIYMNMLEMRAAKLKGKALKTKDAEKCNEILNNALASFVHFILLFTPNVMALAVKDTFEMNFDSLIPLLFLEPDECKQRCDIISQIVLFLHSFYHAGGNETLSQCSLYLLPHLIQGGSFPYL